MASKNLEELRKVLRAAGTCVLRSTVVREEVIIPVEEFRELEAAVNTVLEFERRKMGGQLSAPTRRTLLSRDEAADYLGVMPQTLAVWKCKKLGPLSVKVGRLVKYRRCDLDDWLASRVE